jgi:carboxyl-terminal processing protease
MRQFKILQSVGSWRRLVVPLAFWLTGLLPPAAGIAAEKQPTGGAAADPKRPADAECLDLFRLFADAFDQIDRNYVKEVDRRRMMEAAIRGMLSELDPYSNYISREQLHSFKAGMESEFGGVGIQVTIESGHLQVISPLVGSPAYRAGFLAGDRILEIDGKSTEGMTLDEAVRRMQGKIGEEVKIKLLHRQATEPQVVALRRELIRLESVLGDARQSDDKWQWMIDREKKIAYVRLSAFGRHTADELRKALEELTQQQMRGLILDLRFNPGGLLSAAIEVSDLFVADGRIVSTEGRNAKPKTWDAKKPGTFEGFPMAVLVNRYSASASEIVSACLQDHGRAAIVGERTWGKGSVQNVVELEEGASILKLTTADYHRPNGKNIHRFPDAKETDNWGVTPDAGFAVPLAAAETRQLMELRREKDVLRKSPEPGQTASPPEPPFVDRQFQKALEYVTQKIDQRPAAPTVTAKADIP